MAKKKKTKKKTVKKPTTKKKVVKKKKAMKGAPENKMMVHDDQEAETQPEDIFEDNQIEDQFDIDQELEQITKGRI